MDYARKNGFTNIRHFTDDGIRGTTFKRPGLDAMLEEIRAGNVATVIIKDQSRIGRDVVEVGLLKRTFDEYHVRFIAANDNLNTVNNFDIMSIFLDVINEWYVADTSRCRCAPYLPERPCRENHSQHSKGTPRRENPYPVRALEADGRASPGGKIRMVSYHYRLHTETPGIYGAQGTGENRMRELQDQEQSQDRAGGTGGKGSPVKGELAKARYEKRKAEKGAYGD